MDFHASTPSDISVELVFKVSGASEDGIVLQIFMRSRR